jgi:hypothetical protein
LLCGSNVVACVDVPEKGNHDLVIPYTTYFHWPTTCLSTHFGFGELFRDTLIPSCLSLYIFLYLTFSSLVLPHTSQILSLPVVSYITGNCPLQLHTLSLQNQHSITMKTVQSLLPVFGLVAMANAWYGNSSSEAVSYTTVTTDVYTTVSSHLSISE